MGQPSSKAQDLPTDARKWGEEIAQFAKFSGIIYSAGMRCGMKKKASSYRTWYDGRIKKNVTSKKLAAYLQNEFDTAPRFTCPATTAEKKALRDGLAQR